MQDIDLVLQDELARHLLVAPVVRLGVLGDERDFATKNAVRVVELLHGEVRGVELLHADDREVAGPVPEPADLDRSLVLRERVFGVDL